MGGRILFDAPEYGALNESLFCPTAPHRGHQPCGNEIPHSSFIKLVLSVTEGGRRVAVCARTSEIDWVPIKQLIPTGVIEENRHQVPYIGNSSFSPMAVLEARTRPVWFSSVPANLLVVKALVVRAGLRPAKLPASRFSLATASFSDNRVASLHPAPRLRGRRIFDIALWSRDGKEAGALLCGGNTGQCGREGRAWRRSLGFTN